MRERFKKGLGLVLKILSERKKTQIFQGALLNESEGGLDDCRVRH